MTDVVGHDGKPVGDADEVIRDAGRLNERGGRMRSWAAHAGLALVPRRAPDMSIVGVAGFVPDGGAALDVQGTQPLPHQGSIPCQPTVAQVPLPMSTTAGLFDQQETPRWRLTVLKRRCGNADPFEPGSLH